MIDRLTLYADVSLNLIEHHLNCYSFKELILSPDYNDNGSIVKLKGKWKGLRITLTNCNLKISNSLHVFAKGNNYLDCTFRNLLDAIEELSIFFNISSSEFRIGSFEFGINLIVPKVVSKTWLKIGGYKMHELSPMTKNGRIYGCKIKLTEFAIKLYDKSLEYQLHYGEKTPNNIFRAEIEFNKKRMLPFIKTLEDLKKIENLKQVYDIFVAKIKQIEFIPPLSYFEAISQEDRQLIFSGYNPIFWENENAISKRHSRYLRNRFLKLIRDNESSFDLIEEINCKFSLLVA